MLRSDFCRIDPDPDPCITVSVSTTLFKFEININRTKRQTKVRKCSVIRISRHSPSRTGPSQLWSVPGGYVFW
jgi:hypothetical protein